MNILSLSLTNKDGPAIRGMAGTDGVERWAVYDFVNLVCDKNIKDSYGRITFTRLTNDMSEFANEARTLCLSWKFPGRGQQETPTMSIRGLQRLLMILGGKVASEYRALVETTFTRVMAGDRSLIKIIESNSVSNSAINMTFREALVNDPSPGDGPKDDALDSMTLAYQNEDKALELRKRKLEVDIMELAYKKQKTDAHFEYENKQMQIQKDRLEFMKMVSPHGMIDDQVRMMFKDTMMNQMRNDSPLQITNGESNNNPNNKVITLSSVASEIGMRFTSDELKRIGKNLKNIYVDKYGDNPGRHEQSVDGAVRMVNLYTKRDQDMMEQALRDFHTEKHRPSRNIRTLQQLWAGP